MILKNKTKKGDSILTLPLVTIISITIIIITTVFIVNTMQPFVMYQKLQLISYKYMYIIEKYGCLKEKEKANLLEELSSHGFDEKEITIKSPDKAVGYGNIVEFDINYNYKQKLPSFEGGLKMVTRTIPINVNKTIISKI